MKPYWAEDGEERLVYLKMDAASRRNRQQSFRRQIAFGFATGALCWLVIVLKFC